VFALLSEAARNQTHCTCGGTTREEPGGGVAIRDSHHERMPMHQSTTAEKFEGEDGKKKIFSRPQRTSGILGDTARTRRRDL
jgi:hypothetical protein